MDLDRWANGSRRAECRFDRDGRANDSCLHRRRKALALAGLIAFVLAGSVFSARPLADDSMPLPGMLVSIGSHQLHIHCTGQGAPAVIFESGLGGDLARLDQGAARGLRVHPRVQLRPRGIRLERVRPAAPPCGPNRGGARQAAGVRERAASLRAGRPLLRRPRDPSARRAQTAGGGRFGARGRHPRAAVPTDGGSGDADADGAHRPHLRDRESLGRCRTACRRR